MANRPIKKEVLIRFSEQIIEDLQKKYSDNASLESLCYYLVERGIIPTERARNYVIVRDFQEYSFDSTGTKLNFCFQMEQEYNLSEKQIYNIIAKYLPKFFIDKHIN